jgi:hypothetical protein
MGNFPLLSIWIQTKKYFHKSTQEKKKIIRNVTDFYINKLIRNVKCISISGKSSLSQTVSHSREYTGFMTPVCHQKSRINAGTNPELAET